MVEGSPVRAHPFPNQGKLAGRCAIQTMEHNPRNDSRSSEPLWFSQTTTWGLPVAHGGAATIPTAVPGQYAAPQPGLDYKLLPSPRVPVRASPQCARAHPLQPVCRGARPVN